MLCFFLEIKYMNLFVTAAGGNQEEPKMQGASKSVGNIYQMVLVNDNAAHNGMMTSCRNNMRASSNLSKPITR